MIEEKYETVRTRALRRFISKNKALRKRNITRHCYGLTEHDYYDNLHEYDKGKIHCSCPICRAKTNNKRRKGSMVPKYNPRISEIRRNESMDSQELEE